MLDGVGNIGKDAFTHCSSLVTLTVPGSVRTILQGAFSRCTALQQAILGNGLTEISTDLFSGCTLLRTVTIGCDTRSIDKSAFNDCTSLEEINVTDGSAYFNCEDGILFDRAMTELVLYPRGKKATSYTIPESITTIDTKAFAYAPLEEITIPSTVTTIEDETFVSTHVRSADLHNVTSIGKRAFYNCTALETVTLSDDITSISERTFANCTSLKAVRIPDNVKNVAMEAFLNCSAMTRLTIGTSVESMEYNTFASCTTLESITILALTPPTIQSMTFSGVNKDIPVYACEEAIEKYRTAKYWKDFTNWRITTGTAVTTPVQPETVYTANGMLCNPDGLAITVYDLNGRTVFNGNDTNVQLPAGMYVVKTGKSTRKVVL